MRRSYSNNDVKATKLVARAMDVPFLGFDPLFNDDQAAQVVEHFGLRFLVDRPANFTYFTLTARGSGGKKHSFDGCSRNSAIVQTAAYVIDDKWHEHRHFGINYLTDSSNYDPLQEPDGLIVHEVPAEERKPMTEAEWNRERRKTWWAGFKARLTGD